MSRTMHSVLLTKDLANEAIDIVTPAIQAMSDRKLLRGEDLHLHIVVLNPLCSSAGFTHEQVAEALLCERSFGNREQWKDSFDTYARMKAGVTWCTGLPSAVLKYRRPHLFMYPDIKYGGSVIYEGIIAAASGVQEHFDETIAALVAVTCWGLCMNAMAPIIADPNQVRVVPPKKQ